MATDITAWSQMLALTGTAARRWEPKRLRLLLFSIAGYIAKRSRRVHLRLSGHAPHRALIAAALARLHNLPNLA
ncbi:transposase [Nakamurella antarctica]|uniref:transposase n=1 Tax=Nakamurella antarctica TaxID=1902245 RepID=UPI0030CF7C39